MDLKTLSDRTALARRRLRYVLDHQVLPGLRTELAQQAGSPRTFTEFEGFGVALAALLLQVGLRRDIVVHLFERLADERDPKSKMGLLYSAFHSRKADLLLDGENYCVQLPGQQVWRNLGTGKSVAPTTRPWATVQVDLAELGRAVLGKNSARTLDLP